MSAAAHIELSYALARSDFSLEAALAVPMQGVTGVFGPSGAGKTSLLRCIAGLEPAAHGRLSVAGELWEDDTQRLRLAVHERDIAYVFQEPRLFSHLDVLGNIDYGRRRRAAGRQSRFDDIVAMLDLAPLLSRRTDALSGGEAQRVAIARALLCQPRVLLMDEPLASIDAARKDEILPYLDRLHAAAGMPVVYVSHSIDEICRLCDHLVVLDQGRVLADGDLNAVLVESECAPLRGDDAGAVLSGTVEHYDAEYDLSTIRVSGASLFAAGRHGEAATPVRLRIRAGDVSLCREAPRASSILNVVDVVVDSIEAGSGPARLLRLALGEDRLLARVTRKSLDALHIVAGDRLHAQIKAVSVRPA